MRLFFNNLRCDLYRTLFSLKFVFAVLGLSAVVIFTLLDEFSYMPPGETSITYIRVVTDYLDFRIVYLLFAAIPGATLFCADWENRFIRFSVMRSSKRVYGASKAISCAISAFLVVFLSEWINILLFSLRYPVIDAQNDMNLGPYDAWNKPGLILLYFLVQIVFKAFCAAFLSVLALLISTKITNVFVTLAAPLLCYYLISTFTMAIRLPANFSIVSLSRGLVSVNNDPLLSSLYIVLIFLILTAVCTAAFVRSCRRRIENG